MDKNEHKEKLGAEFGLSGEVLDEAYKIAWESEHAYGFDRVRYMFEDIASVLVTQRDALTQRVEELEDGAAKMQRDVAFLFLNNSSLGSFNANRDWDAVSALLDPILGEGWRDLKHSIIRDRLQAILKKEG